MPVIFAFNHSNSHHRIVHFTQRLVVPGSLRIRQLTNINHLHRLMQDIEPGFVRVSGIGRHKPTKHKAASAQTDRPNAHLKTILRIDPPGRRSGATSSSSFYPSAQATSKEAANVAFTRFESD